MSYEFNFSVLMPIYNVEKYLVEAIDSIINQSIGFEENIELIIIDDGSPDNSKEIALKYQEKFPNNIKVLSKSNGGQASAFNFGLKHVNGKYLSFVDSDDSVSSNTFEDVYNFFEEHYDEIDLVCIPVYFFESRSGSHILNYKFESTRVIDLVEDPYYSLLHIASSFIKREAMEGLEFNTEIIRGYDSQMVNKILSFKKKYGVINSCVYNYRKREAGTSIMDNTKSKKENFNQLIKNFDLALINYCIEKEGSVPKFIQYMVAYDLQWYYGVSDFPDDLEKEEIDEFFETFYKVLSYVDEDVINDSRIIRRNYVRYFLMYLKNRKEFHIETVDDQSEVYLKTGDFIINNLHNHGIYLDSIKIENDILRIFGTFTSSCDYDRLKFEAIKTLPNGEKEIFEEVSDELLKDQSNVKRFLGIDWHFKRYFGFEIPIDEDEFNLGLNVVYDEDGKEVVMHNKIKFRETTLLADMINYFVEDSRIVSFKENSINLSPYSFEKALELKQELLTYIKELLESEKSLKRERKALKKETKSLKKENRSLNKKVNSLDKKNQSLNRRNEKLNDKNKKLKENLKKSRKLNKEIMNSTSWKITKPLRMPKQIIKKR